MKFKMDCECFTNGGNCLASERKKEEEYNKCVFQKNGMNKTNSKERHICALSSKCRRRLISYSKDAEYFDKRICPQIDKKFDMHLKISNKISKKKELLPKK